MNRKERKSTNGENISVFNYFLHSVGDIIGTMFWFGGHGMVGVVELGIAKQIDLLEELARVGDIVDGRD